MPSLLQKSTKWVGIIDILFRYILITATYMKRTRLWGLVFIHGSKKREAGRNAWLSNRTGNFYDNVLDTVIFILFLIFILFFLCISAR